MTKANAMNEPKWGHPLAIWDTGRSIRVPKLVFPMLKDLGLLVGRRAILSPKIILFFNQAMEDQNVHELRQILGVDLSGPKWCRCACRDCRRKESDADQTLTPQMQCIQAEDVVRDVKARRR